MSSHVPEQFSQWQLLRRPIVMNSPLARGLGSAAGTLVVAGAGTLLVVSVATGVASNAIKFHRVRSWWITNSGTVAAASCARCTHFMTYDLVHEYLQARSAVPCKVCSSEARVTCQTCRGGAVLDWVPASGNSKSRPALCPVCQGRGKQKCLNCLGEGKI